METFLHSVSSVLVILLLTAVGYLCAAKGWLNDGAKSFLSKYLISVAVPVMSAYGFMTGIPRDELLRAGPLLLAPTLASGLLTLLGWGIGRLLRLPRKRFGVFVMMCGMSNMMFIGYPMCVELFGEVSVPYAMFNYFVNVCFIQLVGRSLVRWSGGYDDHSVGEAIFNIIRMPPVIGVFAGIAAVLLDVHLPEVVMTTMGYINSTVTPLALLLAGRVIYEIGLRNLRLDRALSVAMLVRFVLSPALAVGFCALFGLGELARNVCAVEFAMPVMTMTVAYSTEYGADEQFAAQGVALSTVACFAVIPILMLVIT